MPVIELNHVTKEFRLGAIQGLRQGAQGMAAGELGEVAGVVVLHGAHLDGLVIDCRGLAARDREPSLRGVKGEMIIIETDRKSVV